jgi:hypothetical protein
MIFYCSSVLPRDIVADKAESSCFRVCLHGSSQRGLSIGCHRISFVKDDNFVRWAWIITVYPTFVLGIVDRVKYLVKKHLLYCSGYGGSGKILDFFTNNLDSTFIRRIKFKNTRSYKFWTKQFAGKC